MVLDMDRPLPTTTISLGLCKNTNKMSRAIEKIPEWQKAGDPASTHQERASTLGRACVETHQRHL